MKISKLNFATALILISGLFMFSSCKKDLLTGEGPIVSDEYILSDFDGIDINVPATVTLSNSSDQSVTINAAQNVLDELDVRVTDNNLKIKLNKKTLQLNDEIEIIVNMDDLDEIDLSGAVDVFIGDFNALNKLDVDVSGSCNITFTEEGTTIKDLDIDLSGSGNFNGFLAEAKSCDMDISGACKTKVSVTEELTIDASGVCEVRYKGDPTLDIDKSGQVDVIKED